jgi:exosortase
MNERSVAAVENGLPHRLPDPCARMAKDGAGWPALVVRLSLGAVAILVATLYAEPGRRLVAQWARDENYTHGFLVLPLACYFVWQRRARLAQLRPTPSPGGAVLLGIGLAELMLGVAGAELFLQRTSFIVVVAGLVLLLLGGRFLRALLFPIAFLAFMVPLPAIVMNSVAFPLQLFAARAATFCLYNLGIPALREGNVIVLAHARLEVVEACSGIRSLQALACLSAVYSQTTSRPTWQKWVLLGASVPIAVAANVVRVSGTGILAHLIGERAAEGFYHSFAGWSVFVVALGLLVALGTFLSRVSERSAVPARLDAPA